MVDKMIRKIRQTNAPIVVGLDPMLSYIPHHIKREAYEEFGETLEGAAEAIWQFNQEIIDKTYDLIPAVKPQIAMYEQFGIEGLKAFKQTIDYCEGKGSDRHRRCQARRYRFHIRSLCGGTSGPRRGGQQDICRALMRILLTVNPYLGTDGIKPFVDVCKEENKGIFILVKTSNPSSGEFQDRLIDGKPLYEWVGEKVDEWGRGITWARRATAMWGP